MNINLFDLKFTADFRNKNAPLDVTKLTSLGTSNQVLALVYGQNGIVPKRSRPKIGGAIQCQIMALSLKDKTLFQQFRRLARG